MAAAAAILRAVAALQSIDREAGDGDGTYRLWSLFEFKKDRVGRFDPQAGRGWRFGIHGTRHPVSGLGRDAAATTPTPSDLGLMIWHFQ